MLQSSLLGESPALVAVANGAQAIQPSLESSDAVARVQQALICLDFELPVAGIDGIFGTETGAAVGAFRTSRGLPFAAPVLDAEMLALLDLEIAYCEGVTGEDVLDEPAVLSKDPFFGGILDDLHPDRGIPDKILRFFELSDEFCLPLSPLVGSQVASLLGRLVEPKFQKDYNKLQGISPGNDFFDLANGPKDYTDFLRAHNPTVPEATIASTGGSVRPDILRHRGDQPEWYEIKPLSPTGVRDWLAKAIKLRYNYSGSFPYAAGRLYTPSREIELGRFWTPEGEHLQVFIEPRRPALGMILYRICLRGDYVKYFNRVRLVAGILAILVALAPEILAVGAAVGEVAAYVELLTALAAKYGVTLPILLPAL